MKRKLSQLIGCTVRAKNGTIGRVEDFYFDDRRWTIRYMVVNTGRWLSGRRVLISTAALRRPQWNSQTFPVNLTQAQVKNSPDIITAKPVSRQHEAELQAYYGWPDYWMMEPYGSVGYPVPTQLPAVAKQKNSARTTAPGDPHLRSSRQVTGYHIQATDGALGHVQDFLVDDTTWAIRYVVVNTRQLLPGKKVLVSPHWIKRVSWDESEVVVSLARESVKNSPAFDPTQPVNRAYENRLFDHYGHPKYWVENSDRDPAHFPCPRCGRKFLSRIELVAHRKKCRSGKKPGGRKTRPGRDSTSIIEKIENLRPEGSEDYRSVDRSS